ncbi:glycosyltransferase [Marinifilum fragile]|uniref:glycosyltransferase n=1 Tax=Marinifilum fragile TaxID=570161 RepID=UPI002AA8D225|nr:glycosyltransferase [Marinifilum fragile]
MRKKKIGQLTSVHNRYDTRIFSKICKSLATANYEVNLIVADGLGDEIKSGINIWDVGLAKSRISRVVNTSKLILNKAIELECVLYHFHDPELMPIGLKLKKLGFKVFFDSHEYLPAQIKDKHYIPEILKRGISYIVEKYFSYSIKKMDAVISVTPHIIEKYKQMKGAVVQITNYPIIEEDINCFDKHDYLSRENFIFYAGTIYETSQQHQVIKSIETINELRYCLVGNITDAYCQELKSLKGWEKVDLVPFVPKFELDVIASNVTIGIAIFDYIPNLGYKTGSLGVNKIFEYMLYGLPIICTDFILWKEIVKKYNCGIYVNSNDIGAISKAIKYLIQNKEEAYEMGQNGRNAVLKEFNWSTQEKILLQLYKSLLS